MTGPVIQTFEGFAAMKGYPANGYVEPGMHTKGHMNETAHKRAMKMLEKRGSEWQAGRDAARAEYEAGVKAGTIRPPTPREQLRFTAMGHPDNAAVQAARRVLLRRYGEVIK